MKKKFYDLLKSNPKNVDTLHDFLLGNYGADFLSSFLEMCQDLDDITTGIDDKYDSRNVTHINMLHGYVVARCINEHMSLIEFAEFFDRIQNYIALIKRGLTKSQSFSIIISG